MRFFSRALSIALALSLFCCCGALAKEDAIRLHILANSDLDIDQEIKLAVRDAIIEAFGSAFCGIDNADEIYEALIDSADDMARVADMTLRELGADYSATAEVGVMRFPEKRYGDIVYPEGEYRALRLKLGEGAGQNWFCVLFPSICLIDTDAELPKIWSLDILRLWIGEWQ